MEGNVEESSFILYHAPGSCSRVTLACLNELRADCDVRLVDLGAQEQQSTWFRCLNPAEKVPVLEHGGRVISETPAILYYLAGHYPALLPLEGNRHQQARVISVMSWLASGVHPVLTRIRVPQKFGENVEDIREKAFGAMAKNFALIDRHLTGRSWYFEGGISAVDFYINWIWYRSAGGGFDVEPYAAFREHAQRMAVRPGVISMESADREYAIKLGIAV
ncbi:glutathione S-transferase family protein [Caballeronia novacaledonica]|uniref:Glutathione S-transferase family protein n=1 Tax=Caballeronia novacaledonica TaxID=1544861 RepID=A0AA37IGG7_9BURK|nr:glutathione S-transferase family protein [Caballeronia novacaledonica]GJH29376.1 glutathione S-transferase family protein [Caballeronia novacaledonica]